MNEKKEEAPAEVLGIPDEEEAPKIPSELPILLMEDTVIYPHTLVPLILKDPHLIAAVDDALSHERIAGAVMLKDKEKGDFYQTGSAVLIHRMLKFPDGTMRMVTQGLAKISITTMIQDEPFPKAQIQVLEERPEKKPCSLHPRRAPGGGHEYRRSLQAGLLHCYVDQDAE
jgi:ATP-dependent Lon protease